MSEYGSMVSNDSVSFTFDDYLKNECVNEVRKAFVDLVTRWNEKRCLITDLKIAQKDASLKRSTERNMDAFEKILKKIKPESDTNFIQEKLTPTGKSETNSDVEIIKEADENQKAEEEENIQESEDLSNVEVDEDVRKVEDDMKAAVMEFCDYVFKRTNKIKPVIWSAQAQDYNVFLQIVFPRLAFALRKFINPFNQDLIEKVITFYKLFIQSTMVSSKYEPNVAKLEILHVSGALIDTDAACSHSLDHLTKAQTCELFELKDWRKERFEQAKEFYLSILPSALVRSAIEKAFNSLTPPQWNMTQVFEEFKNVVEKVVIVDKKIKTWWGMVGIDCIYIHKDVFQLLTPNSIKIKLVGLFFHEGMQYVQRKFKKDVVYLTPPSKESSTLGFEPDYYLDHLIWGHYTVKYWLEPFASLAFEGDRWKYEGSIFTEQEISTAQIRGIMPQCSGLYASDSDCIDM